MERLWCLNLAWKNNRGHAVLGRSTNPEVIVYGHNIDFVTLSNEIISYCHWNYHWMSGCSIFDAYANLLCTFWVILSCASGCDTIAPNDSSHLLSDEFSPVCEHFHSSIQLCVRDGSGCGLRLAISASTYMSHYYAVVSFMKNKGVIFVSFLSAVWTC